MKVAVFILCDPGVKYVEVKIPQRTLSFNLCWTYQPLSMEVMRKGLFAPQGLILCRWTLTHAKVVYCIQNCSAWAWVELLKGVSTKGCYWEARLFSGRRCGDSIVSSHLKWECSCESPVLCTGLPQLQIPASCHHGAVKLCLRFL